MRAYRVATDRGVYERYVHATEAWSDVETYMDELASGGNPAPLPIRLFSEYRIASEKKVKRVRPDITTICPEMFLLSRSAHAQLGHVLESVGVTGRTEGGGDWLAYLPTVFVDALDEDKSEVSRLPQSGRIVEIRKAAFVDHKLAGQSVFQLKGMVGYVYATDEVVDLIKRLGLTGLNFE